MDDKGLKMGEHEEPLIKGVKREYTRPVWKKAQVSDEVTYLFGYAPP